MNLNPGFNSIKQNPSPDIIENEFNLRLGINSKIHFFPLTLKPLEDNNNTFKNNFYDNQGHEQDYDFLKSKTTKVKKSEKDALKNIPNLGGNHLIIEYAQNSFSCFMGLEREFYKSVNQSIIEELKTKN